MPSTVPVVPRAAWGAAKPTKRVVIPTPTPRLWVSGAPDTRSTNLSEPGGALTPPAPVNPGERIDMAESTCSYENCERGASTAGLCTAHYTRRLRGQPMGPPIKVLGQTVAERFWEKVAKGAPDDCWEWQASVFTGRYGYGRFQFGRPRGVVYAHRLAWELTNGQVPEGAHVLHSCDNPPCVNPSHLRIGTPADNAQDMLARKRHRAHLHPESYASDAPWRTARREGHHADR